MHVLILGPTGTAGSAVLAEALTNLEIDRVTTLHRRRTGHQHSKLSEITHTNFTDYSGLEQLFSGIDVCFFCLGISQMKLGLKQLYIFRPGYIHPDNPRSDRPLGERISGALYPLLKFVFPNFVIEARQLARAMITVGLYGYQEQLLNNRMIKEIDC